MKRRLARWMRRAADRLDYEGAPKMVTAYSFTFENRVGMVFNEDGRGCPLWYLGEGDYERAHTEALDPAPWIDWATMTIRDNGWVGGR